jgi:hypothetical protein
LIRITVKAIASGEQANKLAAGFDKVWVNGQLSKDGNNYLGCYGRILAPD